jgi:hypothetical protein
MHEWKYENVVLPMKSILVLFSIHHKNTEKIGNALPKVLNAEIKSPKQVNSEEFHEYDLVGFGSGIYARATMLINYHKSPTGKRSFSQPVRARISE